VQLRSSCGTSSRVSCSPPTRSSTCLTTISGARRPARRMRTTRGCERCGLCTSTMCRRRFCMSSSSFSHRGVACHRVTLVALGVGLAVFYAVFIVGGWRLGRSRPSPCFAPFFLGSLHSYLQVLSFSRSLVLSFSRSLVLSFSRSLREVLLTGIATVPFLEPPKRL